MFSKYPESVIFFPLKLKWESSITSKIIYVKPNMEPTIIEFIEQNQKVHWNYQRRFIGGHNSLFVTLSASRRIIPPSLKGLRELVDGLMDLLEAQVTPSIDSPQFNLGWTNFTIIPHNLNHFPTMLKFLQRKISNEYIIETSLKAIRIEKKNISSFIKSDGFKQFAASRLLDQSSGNIHKINGDRFFGQNINSYTNKILQLLNSVGNWSNSSLHSMIINELITIERDFNQDNKESKYDSVIKRIISNSNPEIILYKGSITLGIENESKLNEIRGVLLGLGYILSPVKKNISFITHRGSAWKLLTVTKNMKLEDELDIPSIGYEPNNELGTVLVKGNKYSAFGINVSDFVEGGVIAGAIGTGKTTLRLHILQFLLKSKVRIIDFDIKGDGSRYPKLGDEGLILVPGINLHMNPFQCPQGYAIREYSDLLIRTFLETIPNVDFSPAQTNLLSKAIYETVKRDGDSRNFYHNLLLLGHAERMIIDNYQDSTAQSLIVRFSWLQDSLGDIFWRKGTTLEEENYANSSLFFDFSHISHTASHNQIRFLVDLVMTRIMATYREGTNHLRAQTVIFVDEAQILMPRRSHSIQLSRLEETVSTLRYKGVSVIAAGVAAHLMSSILLDTNFLAQFRSDSTELLRNLGLDSKKKQNIVNKLPHYQAVIRSKSADMKSLVVSIPVFPEKLDKMGYLKRVKSQILKNYDRLNEFLVDHNNFNSARIDSVFLKDIIIFGQLGENIRKEAGLFIGDILLPKLNLDSYTDGDDIVKLILENFFWALKKGIVSNEVREEPQQFLIITLNEYFKQISNQLESFPKNRSFESRDHLLIPKTLKKLLFEISDIFPEIECDTNRFYLTHSRMNENLLLSQDEIEEYPNLTRFYLAYLLSSVIFPEGSPPREWKEEYLIEVSFDLNIINRKQYLLFSTFVDKMRDREGYHEVISTSFVKTVALEIVVLEKFINSGLVQ